MKVARGYTAFDRRKGKSIPELHLQRLGKAENTAYWATVNSSEGMKSTRSFQKPEEESLEVELRSAVARTRQSHEASSISL